LKPENSVDVRTLCHPDTFDSNKKEVEPYPPITGDIEERCKEALKHIATVSKPSSNILFLVIGKHLTRYFILS
jgi:hypothetical protein